MNKLIISIVILAIAIGHRDRVAADDISRPIALDPPTTSATPEGTAQPNGSSQTTPASTSLISSTTAAPASSSTTSTTTTTTTTPTSSTQAPTPAPTKSPKIATCPSNCSCTQQLVDCSDRDLLQLPKFDPKSTFVDFNFANNRLSQVDFRLLSIATIERLDLSGNVIKTIVTAPTKKNNELPKLEVLDLSDNLLESLVAFNTWKMPQLEILKLDQNEFEKINSSDFSSRTKLEELDLSDLSKLKWIDEGAFAPLTNLQHLNLTASLQRFHLPDQIFSRNQQLYSLDLSDNDLVEVPVALRSTVGIKKLLLNRNLMTSLRRSDFIKRESLEHLEVTQCRRLLRVEPDTFYGLNYLKTLIISNNERFYDFSSNAFYPSDQITSKARTQLLLLDLSNNNMTTLANPTHPPQVQIEQIRLANNPWHCDCNLQWLINIPNQIRQQPIHCKSPFIYKDLEINQFFQTIDCELEESSMQKFVLITFLLFLIVLTVAVFIQKTDICRRLQWRDQYGTIYYTKASFPADKV